jgi:hypothetical protein
MRPLRLLLLVATLAGLAGATVTFERRWKWFQGTIGRGVELAPGGGYFVSGGTSDDGSRFGMLLLRTDSLGDTTWVRQIPDTDMDGGFLSRLADGSPAVLGTDAGRHVMVRKFDPAGDQSWTRLSDTRGMVSAIIAGPDTGCLVVGRLPDGLADFGVIKLGADGQEQWTRYYEEPRVFESWAFGADRTADGGYILCGDCTDYMDSYVRLVRTDSLGVAAWSELYSGPVGPALRAVKQLADGGFVAVGWEFDTLASKERLYIMRTDPAGAVLGTTSLAPAGAAARARAMARTRDGGYIVAGQARWADSTRVWVVRLDQDGDTVWTRVLGGPDNESAYDIEQADDLGYVITGSSTALGGSLLLLKTDSLGGMMTGYAEERPAPGVPRPGLEIYPNPATGTVTVRAAAVTGSSTVRVYDARGRLVHSTSASRASVLRLDAQSLPAGVYLVRLDTDRGPLAGKLVVE